MSRKPRAMGTLLLGALLVLSSCASGFSLRKAEVDPSILTGGVGTEAGANAEPDRLSDEVIVRNAVSAADMDGWRGGPLSWANAGTGSRGTISALAEHWDRGVLCRRFLTTRESYDGVAVYRGEACMAGRGAWRMNRFEPL